MSDTPAELPTTLAQAEPGVAEESSPKFLAMLSRFSPGQMIALGVTIAGMVAFFAYIILRIAQPDFNLLYAGLDLEDSAEIISRLEALGVPYEIHGGGEGISVPADRVARLRMTMAEEGLPRGGSVGDEIFDQAGALGTTSFLANVNQRRALEGELSRTIASLKDVKAARVHLVMPRRELFRREQIEPSASVTLRMFGGRRLDRRQAAAVQHLVAAAVPGLAPDRITLVDDRGTLLVKGGEVGVEDGLASQADDFRTAYEARLKRVIEQLLERSLGAGRVHAEVNAEIDFDQVTMTEETFDPDGQVVRSTQAIEEETERSESDNDGTVTVGNNLPNAGVDGGGGSNNNENITRTEETTNYEISRTVRNHTQVGGQIKRLSVAVVIGGRQVPGETGETLVNEPLDPQELDEVASLVRSAIGFDAERGDIVDVKNMPFVEPVFEEIETSLFDFTKSDVMRLIELAGLLVLTLIAVFLVIRPTIAKLAPDPVKLNPHAAGGMPALTDENGQPVAGSIGADGSVRVSADGTPLPRGEASSSSAMPQLADGATGDEGLVDFDDPARMGMIQLARTAISTRPDDAAAIVRHWISDDMKGSNG